MLLPCSFLRFGATTTSPTMTGVLFIILLLHIPSVWIKPSRTSRMREKRADFVAGCLGGRVIVAGGLGQYLSVYLLIFLFVVKDRQSFD
ncbi:hypothetical protein ILYODFUR_008090 [Ilyodon furcidens]|uniref:Uncharacterized protein n=1 Tax=Ilyodon furcidens TaxID=33524 RepID=A0ABV0UR70_9TELE